MIDNYRQPSNRLSEDDAKEIWRLYKLGWFQNRIAAKFDVNPGRISEVVKGKTFPHLRFGGTSQQGGDDAPRLF